MWSTSKAPSELAVTPSVSHYLITACPNVSLTQVVTVIIVTVFPVFVLTGRTGCDGESWGDAGLYPPAATTTILKPQLLQAGLWILGWAGLASFLPPCALFPASLLFPPQTVFPGLAQKSPAASFPGEEVGIV